MDCCCVCVPPPDTAPVVEPINFWAQEVNIDLIGHQYAEWINGDPESDQPPNDPRGRNNRNNNSRNNNNNNNNNPKNDNQNNKNLLKPTRKEKKKNDETEEERDQDADYRARTSSPWSARPTPQNGRSEDLLRSELNLSPDEIIRRSQQRYPSLTSRKPPHKDEENGSDSESTPSGNNTSSSLSTTTSSTSSLSSPDFDSATTSTSTLSNTPQGPEHFSRRLNNSSLVRRSSSGSRGIQDRDVESRTDSSEGQQGVQIQKRSSFQLVVTDSFIVLFLFILLYLTLKKYFQFQFNFSV